MMHKWIQKVLQTFAAVVFTVIGQLGAYAAEYGYQSDVGHRATVDSARRILAENGGIFIGPEEVAAHFNNRTSLPYRTPFTERDLLDCGRCVLFPAVSRIGYRGVDTSINSLWRAPEATSLFRRGDSLLQPWFKGESFARKPLRTQWHLVRLTVEGRGASPRSQVFYRRQERPPAPNLAFWMLLLLPPDLFVGEYFFTTETVHKGRNIVILGRPGPGAIDISYTPREIGNTKIGRLVEIVPK